MLRMFRKLALISLVFLFYGVSSRFIFAQTVECDNSLTWSDIYITPELPQYCQYVDFTLHAGFSSPDEVGTVVVKVDDKDFNAVATHPSANQVIVQGRIGYDPDFSDTSDLCLAPGSHYISIRVYNAQNTKYCQKIRSFWVPENTCDGVGSWDKIYSTSIPVAYCVPFQFYLQVGDSQGVGKVFAELDGVDIRNVLEITKSGTTAHVQGSVGGSGNCLELGTHRLDMSWTDIKDATSSTCQRSLTFSVVSSSLPNPTPPSPPSPPSPPGNLPKTAIFNKSKNIIALGGFFIFLGLVSASIPPSSLKLKSWYQDVLWKGFNIKVKSRRKKFERKF